MGEGILQQFNINELAGATGLILGALGGLLAVIWKSRCHCKMNLCYICQCERKPPPDNPNEDSSDEENVIPKDTKKDDDKKDDDNIIDTKPNP
jgi:hypothetical protein